MSTNTFADCRRDYVRYGHRATRLHGRHHRQSDSVRRGAGRPGRRRLCRLQGKTHQHAT